MFRQTAEATGTGPARPLFAAVATYEKEQAEERRRQARATKEREAHRLAETEARPIGQLDRRLKGDLETIVESGKGAYVTF